MKNNDRITLQGFNANGRNPKTPAKLERSKSFAESERAMGIARVGIRTPELIFLSKEKCEAVPRQI